MITQTKSLIKRGLRALGVEVRRLPAKPIDELAWFRALGFRTVLDVGANTGQFARLARGYFPACQIYSFEPLGDCFSSLERAFRDDARFRAFNVAVGDHEGVTEMHRSDFSPSSSLLPMGALHKHAFPATSTGRVERVRVARLDDVLAAEKLEQPMLVKLDVQGYEDKVIAGAPRILSQALAVVTEMSVEPLYEGQALFDDIYRSLVDLGFTYRGNWEQLRNPKDGRVLQVDGIFVRR